MRAIRLQMQAEAKQTLDAVYTTATASHYQLEPLNAVAEFNDGKWIVHTGNQWQSLTLPALSKALDIEQNKVIIRPLLFRRWLWPQIIWGLDCTCSTYCKSNWQAG
ncbi:molybdopterin cofactor-binding domain-containing protein (plasmid) [Pseudoalteromonas espejiana]